MEERDFCMFGVSEIYVGFRVIGVIPGIMVLKGRCLPFDWECATHERVTKGRMVPGRVGLLIHTYQFDMIPRIGF